jgi:hypothetical protein
LLTRLTWRLRLRVLRAAVWAARSTLTARRQLAAGVVRPVVPDPPDLPLSAGLGVDAVISRLRPSCLEAAVVRQRWLAAHDIKRDIIVGLPMVDFGITPAHAWIDGMDAQASAEHLELHRWPAGDLDAKRPS